MKIPYVFLNFNKDVSGSDYWDMQLIKDMLSGEMWQPSQGYEFGETSAVVLDDGSLWKSDGVAVKGGVIVIPARHNIGHVKDVQRFIDKLEWCVLILCGDEERLFDYQHLKHPKMKVWLMQPKPDDQADFYLGSGYTPHLKQYVKHTFTPYVTKPFQWSFMGQNNHVRRQLCADMLEKIEPREDWECHLLLTDGFTQGEDKEMYVKIMASSKAVPAPSGIASPDSFRLFEALEAGCVPIADDISLNWEHEGYWRKVFTDEDIPFKVLSDYANLEGYIADVVRDYPALQNKVFAWWQGYKRKMVYKLCEHINELSGLPYIQDTPASKITIIILTSPIKKHPSTIVIDQTIRDLRAVLPKCEIIIGIDGVRPEQEDYRANYEHYKKALLWKCNNEWSNVLPIVFEEHMHQAAMTRQLLKLVKTETILFVEHDTALCPDFEYDWDRFIQAIETGEAYTIRFHFEKQIPDEHSHLMIGEVEEVCGLPMIRTAQWSQRPHLSSTVFYRDMMDRYFTDESRTMIEDKVHGFPHEAYLRDGLMGWQLWRLWIYHPTDGNIKRSYTTDGRGDDPKYDMVF